jgi:3,4-dihydroxy 2-butanone 4-phosphate synthase/GTP cyclohydrolase II
VHSSAVFGFSVHQTRPDILKITNQRCASMQSHIKRVQAALAELLLGKPIILTDDANRENEGDLVFPAEMITAEMMNFIIRHSSGVVCLALPESHLKKLQLPLMLAPEYNTSRCATPFSMSIDATHGITTGVSAGDRVKTIQAALAEHAVPDDLARPGHVFPLQARAGGVFERPGHTEGSIDVMKLAGLKPAAVIAEVMNPDGSVAKGDELKEFAAANQITILSIEDIIDYRLSQENLIGESATTILPLAKWGVFTATVIKEKYNHKEHMVLVNEKSNTGKPPLVRIHSACMTGDLFGSERCDCSQQLQYAMQKIQEEGGVLIYLNQEGRDIGLLNKMKAYALQDQGLDTIAANESLGLPADGRKYYIAANILRELNITTVRLLTNNPDKITGLQKYGVSDVQREPIVMLPNSHNKGYLETKRMKLAHFSY